MKIGWIVNLEKENCIIGLGIPVIHRSILLIKFYLFIYLFIIILDWDIGLL